MDRAEDPAGESSSRDSSDYAAFERVRLGQTLRELRQSRRMTLNVVAQKAKITASFLSQIERGLAMPSLPALYRIARVYDFTPSDLLEQNHESLPVVTRRADRVRVHARDRYTRERLLPASVRTMQVFSGSLGPGATSGEPKTHGDADELVVVIAGSVAVDVDGETYHLASGDTLYYKSSLEHTVRNESDEEAEILWVSAPPT